MVRAARVEDPSGAFLDCFERWLQDISPDEEFDQIATRLYETVPQDVKEEEERAALNAGWALWTVAWIALGRFEEVHRDIVHTAICFAAGAYFRIGIKPLESNYLYRLTAEELEFLVQWWLCCCDLFPELRPSERLLSRRDKKRRARTNPLASPS